MCSSKGVGSRAANGKATGGRPFKLVCTKGHDMKDAYVIVSQATGKTRRRCRTCQLEASNKFNKMIREYREQESRES
jgi:hypothetical protein